MGKTKTIKQPYSVYFNHKTSSLLMANIFINGFNSKAGGGKVILDNYLNSLIKTNSKQKFNFIYICSFNNLI